MLRSAGTKSFRNTENHLQAIFIYSPYNMSLQDVFYILYKFIFIFYDMNLCHRKNFVEIEKNKKDESE